jgi:LSD1 subclass zinc finger protein
MKWIPSFGLDLLARRIAQIVTFDPAILNEASPANVEALAWYRQARKEHPSAFPTDTLSFDAPIPANPLKWENVSAQPIKTVVPCPTCKTKLSLPTGKAGEVKCPKCGTVFQART